VSRYTVEKTLGRGGMATVELAHDMELDRRVAVKRLFASLADDAVFRQRFLREARMAAALSHPNLVAVFDVGDEDGLPYIVMEYVDGETLADLMQRTGPVAPDRAVDLLLQVCAGLQHAHSAELVHRDIKPQNLLVRSDGVVKIADFGIARTLQATQLTQAGTVLGTAAYLAPEQAAGEQVTPTADIYSLGAVGYELLTGRTPYEFTSFADLSLQQREPPAPPSAASAELASLILRCLSFDPNDRPHSAAALAHELAQAPPDVTAPTEVLAPRRRTIHVSQRTVLGLAALLGAVLIAVGLTFAYAGGNSEKPPAAPVQQQDALRRGNTPAESARLLADWLRRRSG
jgi:eukaryotic-like serine/threonine-protein kinase